MCHSRVCVYFPCGHLPVPVGICQGAIRSLLPGLLDTVCTTVDVGDTSSGIAGELWDIGLNSQHSTSAGTEKCTSKLQKLLPVTVQKLLLPLWFFSHANGQWWIVTKYIYASTIFPCSPLLIGYFTFTPLHLF